MIVLGVDPGKATGWILLEGEDADSLRLVESLHGVITPHGAAISAVMTACGRAPLVAIERQHGQALLVDTYGRWLGLAEARGLGVVGVWPASWMARFIGNVRTPKTVTVDGVTRKPNWKEKQAAKATREGAYRTLAVERFSLHASITSDVAAAAWTAAYAVDELCRAREVA